MSAIVSIPVADRRLRLAALLLTAIALTVVMLGAYVRLSDAGLGCPDWPGCYGHLTVPEPGSLATDVPHLAQRPLVTAKAWKEMVHRYLAATLGLGILFMATVAVRRDGWGRSKLPLGLVVLVIFQGLLGMWTVTLLVKPAVVTLHLLGGLATTAGLWWLVLRDGERSTGTAATVGLNRWTVTALVLLIGQIVLGGWTSTNYAALACPDFPTCQGGAWWPQGLDFGEAFVIWRGTGIDYEFGVLDPDARAAIHLTHRLGALAILAAVGGLATALLRRPPLRRLGVLLGGLLLLQLALGVHNVIGDLPLANAVAHNGGAALLLLALVTVLHRLRPAPR